MHKPLDNNDLRLLRSRVPLRSRRSKSAGENQGGVRRLDLYHSVRHFLFLSVHG